MTPPSAASRIARALLRWYDGARRDLPFRRTKDPYAIWVSEVMLQQTQVQTVLPYYERWMRRFPDVRALASADESDVLHAFQGLGYYSRARSLLRAAREVVARFDGALPRSADALATLPGIGAYTAGAIASIAFGERVPVVDGNVVRVLCRLFELRGDPAKSPLKQELWARARSLVPADRPGDFNQALMELGATLCTPRAPRCDACPLRASCRAHASGCAEALPEIPARPKPQAVRMAAALVFHRARVATVQLGPEAPRWAGLWQFPNTELAPDEPEAEGALRAARLALGAAVRLDAELGALTHSVTRYRVRLAAFRCTLDRRPPPARDGALVWRRPSELDAIAMPSAHRRLASWIQS